MRRRRPTGRWSAFVPSIGAEGRRQGGAAAVLTPLADATPLAPVLRGEGLGVRGDGLHCLHPIHTPNPSPPTPLPQPLSPNPSPPTPLPQPLSPNPSPPTPLPQPLSPNPSPPTPLPQPLSPNPSPPTPLPGVPGRGEEVSSGSTWSVHRHDYGALSGLRQGHRLRRSRWRRLGRLSSLSQAVLRAGGGASGRSGRNRTGANRAAADRAAAAAGAGPARRNRRGGRSRTRSDPGAIRRSEAGRSAGRNA